MGNPPKIWKSVERHSTDHYKSTLRHLGKSYDVIWMRFDPPRPSRHVTLERTVTVARTQKCPRRLARGPLVPSPRPRHRHRAPRQGLTPAYPRPRRHAPGPPGAEASRRGAGSARGRGVRCYLDAFRSPQNQLENKAFRAGGETENRPTLCDPAFSREKTQGRAGGAPPTAYPRLTPGLPQGKRGVSGG